MAECRDAAADSEGVGPVARALRATTSVLGAYRAFIAHTQGCAECRVAGVDCCLAMDLREVWRDAKAVHRCE